MKVVVTGTHGFIGSHLVKFLSSQDCEITCAPRHFGKELLEHKDAIIHLGGANLFKRRWTKQFKQELRDSRIATTEHISALIEACRYPPATFIVASAIGFYGDRGHEELTEKSAPGHSFLSSLCQDWERAARAKRVVNARFGTVLSSEGGILKKMKIPATLGNGQQFMSWIALEDLLRALHFLLIHPSIQGPVNCVSPAPLTNREFSKKMGAKFTIPAFLLRAILGEITDEALLSSAYVIPEVLLKNAFTFLFPSLDSFLKSQ